MPGSSHSRISVCMPNFNGLSFLQTSLEGVLSQSHANWELIVVDGGSEDGSWELLVDRAQLDPRIRVCREPKEGIYSAINRCIGRATGEFIYILPSDDVMSPDCLEKMVIALDERRDCDIAHCTLKVIGDDALKMSQWWADESLFALSSGPWVDQLHIRKAPFDGLLHLYGETVYTSLTQLLIRRALFDRVGLFENRWGSIGDFNWTMRAGLVANTIHVPDTWAGWRLHPNQATHAAAIGSWKHRCMIEEMIDNALQCAWCELPVLLRQRLRWGRRRYFIDRLGLIRELQQRPVRFQRLAYLLGQLLAGSRAALSYVIASMTGKGDTWNDRRAAVTRWSDFLNASERIVPADAVTAIVNSLGRR